jgi:serine/threonine protein kinase
VPALGQQIDRKTYGAGLGLYLVANAAAGYVVNVAFGMATEVVCIFDRGTRAPLRLVGVFVHPGQAARPPARRLVRRPRADQAGVMSCRGRRSRRRGCGRTSVRPLPPGPQHRHRRHGRDPPARKTGHRGFEKHVALKMIHPNFSADDHFIQMLIDEAKISVQLQHVEHRADLRPRPRRRHLLHRMEYVDGSDLFRVLRKASEQTASCPSRWRSSIAKEVANGLDYAHATSATPTAGRWAIIHRDVSPQNVLISHAGEVKIVDFGIAKATMRAKQTAVGVIKGKYYYMSPSKPGATSSTIAPDIFSAGILLYEMLTGQMLYLEEDMNQAPRHGAPGRHPAARRASGARCRASWTSSSCARWPRSPTCAGSQRTTSAPSSRSSCTATPPTSPPRSWRSSSARRSPSPRPPGPGPAPGAGHRAAVDRRLARRVQ